MVISSQKTSRVINTFKECWLLLICGFGWICTFLCDLTMTTEFIHHSTIYFFCWSYFHHSKFLIPNWITDAIHSNRLVLLFGTNSIILIVGQFKCIPNQSWFFLLSTSFLSNDNNGFGQCLPQTTNSWNFFQLKNGSIELLLLWCAKCSRNQNHLYFTRTTKLRAWSLNMIVNKWNFRKICVTNVHFIRSINLEL